MTASMISLFKQPLCNDIPAHHCNMIAQSLKKDGMIYEGGLEHLVNLMEGKKKQQTENLKRTKYHIEVFYSEIVNKLDPVAILNKFPNILDDHTRQRVLGEKGSISQTAMMLYYVLKNDDSIKNLMIALRSGECGSCSHLVSLMEGSDGSFTPSEAALNVKMLGRLCTHSRRIHNDFEPLDLRKHFTMDECQWNDIEHCSTRQERVNMFLDFLACTESLWFKLFVTALEECDIHDYSELASDLERDCNDEDENTSGDNRRMEDDVWQTEESVIMEEVDVDVNAAPEPGTFLTVGMSEKVIVHDAEEPPSFLNDFDKPQINTEEGNTTAKPLGNSSKQESTLEHLQLRDYQMELAQPALNGKNSMIVAPTGSGKTFVALKICEEHIKNNKDSKVVFLIPRVPLVNQQHELFKRFLGDKENLLLRVTGETSSRVPVHISLERNKIAFMTPQILLDLLKGKLVKISDFTLLVIDECHHTVKNDPYNNIMKIYLDERLSSPKPGKSKPRLPQIVGLTASPGIGKAKKMSDAEENIKVLMANLDVTVAPTCVKESLQNLQAFRNDAEDLISVVVREKDDDFRESICKSMDATQTLVEETITANQNHLANEIKYDLTAIQGSQDYEAWVITLGNRSKKLEDSDLSYNLMMYAKCLLAYNTALVLNDHVRSLDAEETLYNHMDMFRSEHPTLETLYSIYEQFKKEPLQKVNALLQALHKVLTHEFQSNSDSRCIIFVRTRSIATGIITYLGEADMLMNKLNPKLLTGAGVSGEKGGMTKREQESTLEAFRTGKCKVIVATSVAEEGLDIKACNLIINYNYSTNEVGHVQRKGRGRAENSKVITLAYDDSRHVHKERENKIRVELTDEMLNTIRSLQHDNLEKQIREIQRKAKKNRDIERKMKAGKRLKMKKTDVEYDLLCLWCKQKATTSHYLRHINKQHRVIVDPDFVARAAVKIEKDKTKWKKLTDDNFVTGKMFCDNRLCRNHLGYRMKHKHLTLSVPKVTSFLFTNSLGERETYDKWGEVCFNVKELSEEDMTELLDLSENEIEDDMNYE